MTQFSKIRVLSYVLYTLYLDGLDLSYPEAKCRPLHIIQQCPEHVCYLLSDAGEELMLPRHMLSYNPTSN